MNCLERRRAERFKGAIPIELKDGRGLSRDFSTDGIYFETDQSFSIGEHIDFTMQLDHADQANPLRVRCQGKVVRLEAAFGMSGVAVAITTHQFEVGT